MTALDPAFVSLGFLELPQIGNHPLFYLREYPAACLLPSKELEDVVAIRALNDPADLPHRKGEDHAVDRLGHDPAREKVEIAALCGLRPNGNFPRHLTKILSHLQSFQDRLRPSPVADNDLGDLAPGGACLERFASLEKLSPCPSPTISRTRAVPAPGSESPPPSVPAWGWSASDRA